MRDAHWKAFCERHLKDSPRWKVWKGLLLTGAALVAATVLWQGALGQGCGPWVRVEVDPPNPTSNDPITLILSGIWCDSCTPGSPTVSVVGNTITVRTTNKSPMCFPVQTPWELSVPVGRLSPGRYSVLVVHNGQPIGGLEILEVRRAGPDFVIEAIRWTPVSPSVGEEYVHFEVMIANAGGERAPLAGVVLELHKVKGGGRTVVGRKTWASGYVDPGRTIVASLSTDRYSALTWEGGTFRVEACMDATGVVGETDETNNCIERPIVIQGAALSLLVAASCVTLLPYSLLDVPIAYEVRTPLDTPVEAGTKKTPFSLVFPQGFRVILDAPQTHELHRLMCWKVGSTPPSLVSDPLKVELLPSIPRVEAWYAVPPERKCTECFRGSLGPSDACGNGTGYSVPGPGGGDPRCLTADCCNWYQVSHVHDLGGTVVNVHLVLEYTPGFLDGCQGTLTVEISPDGQGWTPIYTAPTTTVDLNPPHQLWGTHITCLRVERMTPFRYVRVTVTNCYVDYSAVYVCGD